MAEPNAARTFINSDGRTLLFSCEDFVEQICKGGACFICGASPTQTTFNDEHIVPRWVLRRFNLFDKAITLPGGEKRRYGGYRVQCCASCNAVLGERVENPVSELLSGEFGTVAARMASEDAVELVYIWLCLLFLKVHLKDAAVPVHKDRRRGTHVIGDLYDWADLHHVHAVARAPYTGATLLPFVVGSIFFVEVDDRGGDEWDFVDLTFAHTIAVRVGRVGIVAVLNDAGAAESSWSHRLSSIDAPISGAQFRELAAMFAVANDDILERPTYGTLIIQERWVTIFAKVPAKLRMANFDQKKFGAALEFALGNMIDRIAVDGSRDPNYVRERVASGEVRFLIDEKGRFRPGSAVWAPSD
ncbi:hypothetical protein [Phenylobacterium sp.]|jgi:hypothetical protein|uniref:hypothetical protein n=1 Tax=Phenylobacterium sp. TaxID=1871053 RepID=UPI0037845B3C